MSQPSRTMSKHKSLPTKHQLVTVITFIVARQHYPCLLVHKFKGQNPIGDQLQEKAETPIEYPLCLIFVIKQSVYQHSMGECNRGSYSSGLWTCCFSKSKQTPCELLAKEFVGAWADKALIIAGQHYLRWMVKAPLDKVPLDVWIHPKPGWQ